MARAAAAPPVPAATPPAPAPAKIAAPPKPVDTPIDESLYSAEIDALDSGSPPPKPSPQPGKSGKVELEPDPELDPTPPEEGGEGGEKGTNEEIDDLDEIPTEEPPKAGKAPEGEKVPTRARDLKVVYEQVKAEKKTLETKLTEVTAEVERLRKGNPEEVKVLTKRLEEAEASRKAVESELRYVNYQKHPEFVEKYQKPYIEAWNSALADIAELTIQEEGQQERPATEKDLLVLANMPYGQAAIKAEQLFGPVAATQMMAHRKNIIELSRAQSKALEESKKSAEEHDKLRQVEERQTNERLSKMWNDEKASYETRFPKWSKPVEGDEEGNKVFERGMEDVDRFFKDTEMTPEERIKLHVKIRAKAANHDRLALRLKRLTAKLAEVKKSLEEYEGAEPPGGRTRRAGGKPSGDVFETAAAEIEALDER